MKRLEWVALMGVILFLVVDAGQTYSWAYLAGLREIAQGTRAPTIIRLFGNLILIKAIIMLLIHFGIAVWLYRLVSRDEGRPSPWSVFGFLFGLIAPVLFCFAKTARTLMNNHAENRS